MEKLQKSFLGRFFYRRKERIKRPSFFLSFATIATMAALSIMEVVGIIQGTISLYSDYTAELQAIEELGARYTQLETLYAFCKGGGTLDVCNFFFFLIFLKVKLTF